MMSGILSPAFLQAAGRAGKVKHEPFSGIILMSLMADPEISSITGTDIVVTTTKNGQPHTDTYASLSSDTLAISADKDTKIIISGLISDELEIGNSVDFVSIQILNTSIEVLNINSCFALQSLDLIKNASLIDLGCQDCVNLYSLNIIEDTLETMNLTNCYTLQSLDLSKCPNVTGISAGNCYALQSLNLSNNLALYSLNINTCYTLQSLNLSANTALTSLNCSDCYAMQELNLSANTALTDLDCSGCLALTDLDLSKNTALTQLNCTNSYGLTKIKYGATNSDVSTEVAGAITDADAADGTVYTDSAGAYYSTIETAAQAKGWTIEQL